MINTFNKLDMLQAQINSEKNKYKEAIRNNQKFEEVKLIFLKIKELQKEADELSNMQTNYIKHKSEPF